MDRAVPGVALPAAAALRHLVEMYAHAVDQRELDTAAALFTDDAALTLPDVPAKLEPCTEHRGRDAIRSALGGVSTCLHTLHAVVGHTATIGATATEAFGQTACVAHHVLPGASGPEDWVWTIQYHDEYVRDEHGWRFRARSAQVDWIEVRPVRYVRR